MRMGDVSHPMSFVAGFPAFVVSGRQMGKKSGKKSEADVRRSLAIMCVLCCVV